MPSHMCELSEVQDLVEFRRTARPVITQLVGDVEQHLSELGLVIFDVHRSLLDQHTTYRLARPSMAFSRPASHRGVTTRWPSVAREFTRCLLGCTRRCEICSNFADCLGDRPAMTSSLDVKPGRPQPTRLGRIAAHAPKYGTSRLAALRTRTPGSHLLGMVADSKSTAGRSITLGISWSRKSAAACRVRRAHLGKQLVEPIDDRPRRGPLPTRGRCHPRRSPTQGHEGRVRR